MVRFANDQFVFLLYENVAPFPIVRSVTFGRLPLWLNVPAPVTVRFVTPSIVPELLNVVTVEIVTLASLAAAIVPAFVTLVIFEMVEATGS